MKSNKITQMIREELKKVIKEESQNRYVVTVQFYVWGNNEVSAKKEAAQIIQTIEHKYDNSPQVTDIVSQQFGKFGSTPISQEQKVTEAEDSNDFESDEFLNADNPEQSEPDEEDCFVESNGFKLSVSCGGKFIGEFTEDEDAYKAVRDWKKKNNWTPNTWFVSDHGNVMLVDDNGNEIREGEREKSI